MKRVPIPVKFPVLVEIPWLEPIEAAARFAGGRRLAFLDSAMAHPTLGRWSYLAAEPAGMFRVVDGVATWNGTALAEAPIPALRRLLTEHGRPTIENGPPFQGGAIGHLAYEAGRLFEQLPAMPAAAGRAQIEFGFYDNLVAFDGIERRAFLVAGDGAGIAALRETLRREPARAQSLPAIAWEDSRSRAAYEAEVARVIRYIRDGDIFQANLSHRFTARPDAAPDALTLYRALRKANPAPFAALLVDGPCFIASSSPERFLRLANGGVEARPIKGTIRRSPAPAEDARRASRLAASEKDRAENVMIVDLLRNDLSRVCAPHSVEVPTLCGIESYASVHHLTSVVTGRLAAERDVLDLIAATFPGGSITGAPKIRAMEIIAELEQGERGIYCGSIGWIGYDGAADLNIAIRTLACDGETLTIGAGGGVTLLSDPAAEYEETLAKAERMLAAFAASSDRADDAA